MKIILKIIGGLVFLPYILFACMSIVITWFFNKPKSDEIPDSAEEFMKINYVPLLILCIGIWVYIISKIY